MCQHLRSGAVVTVSRVLFLARYRVPHACLSLQFDRFLEGIDRTVISTPIPPDELEPIWQKYKIDSSRFEYVQDQDIFDQYPEINNWVFADDYRGWWLRQQAIKLSVLDYLKHDVMLMQDPDTFMIEPYRCYDQGRLKFCVLENTTHGSYTGMINSIFGFARQTPHCFITEFVPCMSQDIESMKLFLEHLHGCHWLDALINNTTKMPTIPPWGNGEIIRWFSEYEIIGNWTMSCRSVDFMFQRRFEYSSLEKLSQLSRYYNAVADAIPDLSMSLQFDWSRNEVVDFDHWLNIINQQITQ
jgi:hypothetical protein